MLEPPKLASHHGTTEAEEHPDCVLVATLDAQHAHALTPAHDFELLLAASRSELSAQTALTFHQFEHMSFKLLQVPAVPISTFPSGRALQKLKLALQSWEYRSEQRSGRSEPRSRVGQRKWNGIR